MRLLGLLLTIGSGLGSAATLDKLGLEEMIQKSTEIVCGKVVASSAVKRGLVVYTQYRLRVTDRWKGNAASEIDVHVPGGKHGSQRQLFSGSPTLDEGKEYVMFLWTSRAGLTQVIGLSQGLFDVKRDPKGEPVLTRYSSSENSIPDSSGRVVEEPPVSMRLGDMVDRIHRTLTGASR
jgi:hypothetical protein